MSAIATGTVKREKARSTLYFILQGIRRDKFAMIGATVVALFVLIAVFAPFISPYGPNEAFPALRLKGLGTAGHILGLDAQGRDILSRLIYGSRLTLFTGITPVFAGAVISILLGMTAAYYDRAGNVIMRVMDVFFAFPMVLLAIMVTAFMGAGSEKLLMALVIVLVPYNTRVVYIEAYAQKKMAYIEAARAAATTDFNILIRDMLPNVVAACVVYSTTQVGNIIITAAGLSFLGLGVQPPTPEWGVMTSDGRAVLAIAPHVSTVPGIAITLLVVAFNLVGDSLRDALDPRTRLQQISAAK